ncbi:GIY-YIG nuclease family protein [Sphingobium indicum]|uniref:Excinuclease ABC subunit C n=3 Tax=Sphingobium indicum TaxID=332055 RepID=A0A1L5BN40_SPHIB|nr:GIY-YIG nuclease family protein [Sphingobium indicum]APL94350.1 excinuclease ABC subunit C [Sphingobium indicum B90A]EPR16611.1 excinuclease ABC subunit C [Sphingobium indicum IP26]NYI24429.1 putative endonuclease [Sphingobium indicum]RYM04088.1 GIY-YIG nuclease family protein [Sphingobium indicum]
MAFWTYMLRCSDGRYYTGHTDDLEHRIGQHQSGQGSQFTRRRLPVTLVWSEAFSSRIEALEAERIVGGWSRAKKEAMIAGNWSSVSHFARPPRERFSTSACPERLPSQAVEGLETNGCGGDEFRGEDAS